MATVFLPVIEVDAFGNYCDGRIISVADAVLSYNRLLAELEVATTVILNEPRTTYDDYLSRLDMHCKTVMNHLLVVSRYAKTLHDYSTDPANELNEAVLLMFHALLTEKIPSIEKLCDKVNDALKDATLAVEIAKGRRDTTVGPWTDVRVVPAPEHSSFGFDLPSRFDSGDQSPKPRRRNPLAMSVYPWAPMLNPLDVPFKL